MYKSIAFTAAGVLAASALAATVIVGSHGRGRAQTRDGRIGNFNFEVAKQTVNDREATLKGRFRFEQQANRKGPFVLIEMGNPATLAVTPTGKVCEFGGRGVLVRFVDNRRVSFPGRVEVRVEDRRTPQLPRNDPDKFRVRFRAESGLTFEFDGLVNDGDLVVFRR